MSDDFSIETRAMDIPGCGVVIPHGAIEMAECNAVSETVGRIIAKGWNRLIVLDFADVPHIEGDAGLISSLSQVQDAGGRLAVINMNEPIMEVFDMLALVEVIPILRTMADAEALGRGEHGAPVPPKGAKQEMPAPASTPAPAKVAGSATHASPEGCCIVKLSGFPEYDYTEAFKAEVMPMIEEGMCRFLIIDCGSCEGIGEGLLGALLDAQQELKDSGGALLWADLSGKVHRVLDMFNMLDQSRVFDAVAQAQSFAATWIKLGHAP